MKSFAELSHPEPEEREHPAPTPDTLRDQVRALNLSNSVIARAIGKSSGLISQWLNSKYTGDNAAIEIAITEFLRDRNTARLSGVTTIETDVSRFLCRKLEEVRIARDLAVITGPAGVGKSRGLGLYLTTHVLAISFRVSGMHTGMSALADDLSRAADINRIKRGQRRWDVIVEKTTGSDRLLIVDDAHELGPRSLQCCVDYHEQTGNPVALLGLPKLKQRLLADARRSSRADEAPEIPLKDPRPIIEHLVNELAPGSNGDRETLIGLCLQVAAHDGCFRSVEKQLQLAGKYRRKRPDLPWPAAFHAAHKRLLRAYTLN